MAETKLNNSQVNYDVPVNSSDINYDTPINNSDINYDVPVDNSNINYDVPVNNSNINYDVPVNNSNINYDTPVNNSDINYDVQVAGSDVDTSTMQQADESNFGVSQKATDQDVVDGTEDTKFITAKQAADNYGGTTSRVFTDTLTFNTSPGFEVFAHGLSVTPRKVTLFLPYIYNDNQRTVSIGYYGTDGNTSTVRGTSFANSGQTDNGTDVYLTRFVWSDSPYASVDYYVDSIDATNITLNRVINGSPGQTPDSGEFIMVVEG